MKPFLISLLFIWTTSAAPEAALPKEEWKSKLDSLLPSDPDFVFNDINLSLASEKKQQAKLYLVPQIELFYTSLISKENSSFKNSQYGLSANVGLFQFGQSYYNYLSQNASFEVQKLEYSRKKIEIENKILTSLFKNTLLLKKLALYKQIENLKRKALKVAQQRYDRGNLPRQQLEKVEIDLTNLSSQRITTERELAESEMEILKYQLSDFKREWPFAGMANKVKKSLKPEDFADIKILNLKSESFENLLVSSRRAYFPSLGLTGRAYQWKQDQTQSQEWDISLTVSWPLWDNYSRSITNLTAYRDFQYWQLEKTRVVRDWQKKVSTKEEQLEKLSAQLNQSAENLKKLNALYADTESLFSQGRITVNELFQDQQLLLETQINYENELYAFHQFVMEYCSFYSERIWSCF
jgi:outer membrane protein TolC